MSNGPKGVLTDVVAPIAPLAAAIAALAVTGTIGRLQRDRPAWAAVAFGLVILASTLWLAGSFWSGAAQTWLRGVGALIFGAGAIIAIVLAVKASGAEPRPRVEASLSPDRSTVTATITASDLTTNQRLAILVDALNNGVLRSHLYQGYIGGDTDGHVKQTIAIGVPHTEVTDIGVKAFTNQVSTKCDDLAPETQSEAEKKQEHVRAEERVQKTTSPPAKEKTQLEQTDQASRAENGDPGSGTGCVILSVVKP